MLEKNTINNVIIFNKYLRILISLYIFSLSIHFWNFKYIRIAEIIFLLLVLYITFGVSINKFKVNIIKSDIPFILFFISALILFVFNNFNSDYLLGIIFSFYIFSIYFIFRNLLKIYDYIYFLRIILFSVFISALLGILGWSLHQFEIDNMFAFNYEYPLRIGKSARASGTFSTPSMLAIHIITCLIILISIKKNIKLYKIYLVIFSVSLLLTFSKSVLILFSVYLIYSFKFISNKVIKIFIFCSFIILFFSQIFFTNIMIIEKNKNYEWLTDAFIPTNAKYILEIKNYNIYYSVYGYLKLKNIEVIKENFPNGIGFRNFDNYEVPKYKYLHEFDPHSNYLGIVSEFGALGAIALLFLFLFLLNKSKKYYQDNNSIFIFLFIIFILIESINTDILSYKIFWIFAAIIIHKNQNEKIKDNSLN